MLRPFSGAGRRLGHQFHTVTRATANPSATTAPLFRPFSRGFAARSRAIGIDLGTSNSCVAVKEGDSVKVIENDEGARTTPSVVGFHKGELLVGKPAKNQLVTEPENTFYAVKRLIGRRWDDPVIKKDIDHVGYKIVKGKNGDAWVATKDGTKYSPSQIGAYVLQNLKKSAESYLNHEVKDAVITVPAYFNNEQRQATKDAGAIAGLNVLRVINEPTAAAIAYGVKAEGDKTLAVFDLGGGTFDISILEVADDVFEVRSTNGDTFLGGEDFDKAIIDLWCAQFKKANQIDLKKDPIALQRLREAAESVKRSLDKKPKAEEALPWISQGPSGPLHFTAAMTRPELEKLVMPIIEKTKLPCLTALKDAAKKPSEIDEVLLVGGMTRMPRVQEFVEEIFGQKPNKGINPDEAVAFGAAIQAAIASGDKFEDRDMVVLDIVPLSLGIETLGGINTTLIPKGTVLPTRKAKVFSTAQDNQTQVEVHVLQGERTMAADCHTLGRFNLKDIPQAARGIPQIEVAFDIDQNSIVNVTATDKGTGKASQIEVKVKGGLSDAEIEKMKEEAEMYADQDKAKRETVEARHSAQSLADSTRKQLDEHKDKLDAETISQIENDLEALNALLADEDSDADQVKAALDDLQKSAMKMGAAIYKDSTAADGQGEHAEGTTADAEATEEKDAKDEERK